MQMGAGETCDARRARTGARTSFLVTEFSGKLQRVSLGGNVAFYTLPE